MRACPLLSWAAQAAAHAAYVERLQAERPPAPTGPGRGCGPRVRGQTDRSLANRERLLHALRDGRPHRFADIQTALPGLSRQGIYYLCTQLKAEGRLDWTNANRSNRIYRLT